MFFYLLFYVMDMAHGAPSTLPVLPVLDITNVVQNVIITFSGGGTSIQRIVGPSIRPTIFI